MRESGSGGTGPKQGKDASETKTPPRRWLQRAPALGPYVRARRAFRGRRG